MIETPHTQDQITSFKERVDNCLIQHSFIEIDFVFRDQIMDFLDNLAALQIAIGSHNPIDTQVQELTDLSRDMRLHVGSIGEILPDLKDVVGDLFEHTAGLIDSTKPELSKYAANIRMKVDFLLNMQREVEVMPRTNVPK